MPASRTIKRKTGTATPGQPCWRLPKDRWTTLEGLDREKVNVLYCYPQVCHLAATAAVQFASNDFSAIELEGGFGGWKENELKIEK